MRIGIRVFLGILPLGQGHGMKSVFLKKLSVDTEENILTQPRAHTGEAPAGVALRRRS